MDHILFFVAIVHLLKNRNPSYTVEFAGNSQFILLASVERFNITKLKNQGRVCSNQRCYECHSEPRLLLHMHLLSRGDLLGSCSPRVSRERPLKCTGKFQITFQNLHPEATSKPGPSQGVCVPVAHLEGRGK